MYPTKASASVLIGYIETVCKEIRAAVRQLADVCARVELLDPENTKRQEFLEVGRALQVASIQTGPVMQKMMDTMERQGA